MSLVIGGCVDPEAVDGRLCAVGCVDRRLCRSHEHRRDHIEGFLSDPPSMMTHRGGDSDGKGPRQSRGTAGD